eukprot:scaffold222096_cov29-Attheya_sp.AAC.1
MGSVDASRSCALNPGRHFVIGRRVVEVRFVLYAVARTTLVVGCVTLRVPMCAIDASRSCGSNAAANGWGDESMRLVQAVLTLVALLELDGWLVVDIRAPPVPMEYKRNK